MRFPPLPDEQEKAARARQQARASRASRRRAPRTDEQRARDRVYNAVGLAFLLATIAMVIVVAFLWTNYNSPLNPLAPPTPFPMVVTATFTPTPTLTPSATPTPAPTLTPSDVPSLAPSLTFTPVALDGFTTPGTPVLPSGGTPLVVGTPAEGETFPFAVARVIYITNPPGRGGCNWASIAGSVVTYEGAAVNGYSVRLVGEGLDQTVTTGSAPGNGPGGFEVQIGESARAGVYAAQLIDPAGLPASAVIPVTAREDCAQNIAALRFVATTPS